MLTLFNTELILSICVEESYTILISSIIIPFIEQKFPGEGLANVVRNVFDFDSYNKDTREVLIEALHKHGIPIGAKPSSVKLAKE